MYSILNFHCTAAVDFSSANQRMQFTFSSIKVMGFKLIVKKTKENSFTYLKIVINFVMKNYSIAILITRYLKLSNPFHKLFVNKNKVTNFLMCTRTL